jgi:DNA repair exonuclease SbcCD ATPase subunit
VVQKHLSELTPSALFEAYEFIDALMEKGDSLSAEKRDLEEFFRGQGEERAKKNEELMALHQTIRIQEEALSEMRRDVRSVKGENERLLLQNEELRAINRLYVEENLRKEAYLAEISKSLERKAGTS